MPAGDAEHATRQLWRHYSGVQSSSPVSGAVGAVGGGGGGQGLVCGFSPDLLADLLVPEHAELEMLDLTPHAVSTFESEAPVLDGSADLVLDNPMSDLGILGLRIQRMPSDSSREGEFGDLSQYPYQVVSLFSSLPFSLSFSSTLGAVFFGAMADECCDDRNNF